MAKNDLGVSMDEMQAAAQEMGSPAAIAEANIEADLDAGGELSGLEETIDVPESGFWDNEDPDHSDTDSGDADGEVPEDSGEADVPQSGIITYKANGEDITIDLSDPAVQEEVAKKLAAADGVKKAFSDKAKLRQQVKSLKERADAGNQYKESWDKLEALKDNPEKLYEVITGQSFDEMVKNRTERRGIYESATDEERKLMDYEDRIRSMELNSQKDAKRREAELKQAEERNYEASKKETQTKLEREFFKYEFDKSDAAQSNKLRKILWRSALGDIQDYQKEGYKVSDKLVAKAFSDNAKALQSFYGKEVAKGVKKVTEEKSAAAKEKAQVASTRNYSKTDFGDMQDKDPMSLFRAFQRKK